MQTALAPTPVTPSAAPAGPLDRDVARAARGDRAAFEALYRVHADRVFALCLRMCGDRTLAAELTQDAFVRAWERLPQFRGDAAFGTWLHRIAVNVVLEARRRDRRRHVDTTDDGADTRPLDALVEPRGAREGDRIDLAAAIAALPTGARTVFALHDVEGYKHEEIARMLDITAGGSKAQLHRARRLLREALQ